MRVPMNHYETCGLCHSRGCLCRAREELKRTLDGLPVDREFHATIMAGADALQANEVEEVRRRLESLAAAAPVIRRERWVLQQRLGHLSPLAWAD